MLGRRNLLKLLGIGASSAVIIPSPLAASARRDATWALDSPSWSLGRIPCSATFDLVDNHGIGAIPAEVKRGDYWWLCGEHADIAVMGESGLYFQCAKCARLHALATHNPSAEYHGDLLVTLTPQLPIPRAMMPTGENYRYELRAVTNATEQEMDSDPRAAIKRAFSPYLFYKYMSERDINCLIAAWRVRRQGPVGLTHLDSLKRRGAGLPTVGLHEVNNLKDRRLAELWQHAEILS